MYFTLLSYDNYINKIRFLRIKIRFLRKKKSLKKFGYFFLIFKIFYNFELLACDYYIKNILYLKSYHYF